MATADSDHITTEHPTERPADSLDSFAANLATQQRARETALQRLARLRKEASAEIDRLLSFLDASDDYVQTECEMEDEADELERYEGDEADDEGDTCDDEPSLGAPERHPSEFMPNGRNSTGDQTKWAAGRRDDREQDAGDEGEAGVSAVAQKHLDRYRAWCARNNVECT